MCHGWIRTTIQNKYQNQHKTAFADHLTSIMWCISV